MSENENENVTQGNGAAGWGWEPVPQGGEYDSDATAFVKLPQDMLDALGTGEPLAAPGHGYVPPPMIVPLGTAGTGSTDPAATGTWTLPAQWPEAGGEAAGPGTGSGPVTGPIPASVPIPAAVAAAFADTGPETEQDPAHDPGATAEWRFPEAAHEPGATPSTTGQWAVPEYAGYPADADYQDGPDHRDGADFLDGADYRDGADFRDGSDYTGGTGHPGAQQGEPADHPRPQGDFRTGALDADWSQAPATLPGGAPAPWAYLTQQPAADPGVLPGTDEAAAAAAAAAATAHAAGRLFGGPGVGAAGRGPRVLGGPGVGTALQEAEPAHGAPHDVEAAHDAAHDPSANPPAGERPRPTAGAEETYPAADRTGHPVHAEQADHAEQVGDAGHGGYAGHADHGAQAGHAAHGEQADYAGHAEHVGDAGHGGYAGHAGHADHGAQAGHAAHGEQADYAGHAEQVGDAGHGGYAGHADHGAQAGHAVHAEHPGHATHATHAEHVGDAGQAAGHAVPEPAPAGHGLFGGAPASADAPESAAAADAQPAEQPGPDGPGRTAGLAHPPHAAHPADTDGHGFSAFGQAPEPAPAAGPADGQGEDHADVPADEDAPAPASADHDAAELPQAGNGDGLPAEQPAYPEHAAHPAPGAHEAPVTHLEHPHASYVLRVNGADRPVTGAWIGESLLYVLRERLGLAGAKDGCSQGECGACAVQVDGRLVASCLVPAATAAGSEVRTVEGLATNGELSDVQQALCRSGGVQCGFCVPGMAMTIHDLLEGNHAPSELETRQALCGNLCRCSGYAGVVDAVREVVAEREAASAASADAPQSPSEARIPHQAAPGEGGIHHGGTA
ncbi:2Fe-2S iron-sulfur cluster-binding protein [Streptomyces sp. NPDC051815]|uniref:2Fe-2S iron-sulfur cluster-binding protein n=1 Tax=Streptomyces sp. NPDC051815 TaxID=3365674 RepID=UPI00378ABD32